MLLPLLLAATCVFTVWGGTDALTSGTDTSTSLQLPVVSDGFKTLPGGRHYYQCAKPVNKAALEATCPPTKGGRCQSLLLRNVCLVQETFVMFDEGHPDGANAFPDFDVTDVPYWYRHASPDQVEHLTHATPHPHQHPSTVLATLR